VTFTANDFNRSVTAVAKWTGSPQLITQHLQPGARAYFVRSAGKASGMDSSLAERLQSTVKGTLAKCRSGQNDVIFVLPGHTETIDSAWATDLVASTKIIGLGNVRNSNAPLFTFNATGSTIDVDVADVAIANCRFTASIAAVAIGIDVNEEGFVFSGNLCTVGRAGPYNFTIFMDVGDDGEYATIVGNSFKGITGAGSVITVGAAADVVIANNHIAAVPTHISTAGLLNIDGNAQRLLIDRNSFSADLTASTCCVIVGDGASPSGSLRNNTYAVRGVAANTNGFIDNSGAGTPILSHFENYVADPNLSGILTPAAT
jgi:hypothetical protein